MRKSFLTEALAPAVALVAPALLSIYFTFVANDFNRGLVWDSAHYLLSAQSLLTWLTGCLHNHYISPAKIDLGPAIMVDGPVLPAFGAALIALGNVVHAAPAISILLGQSLVCGLNSLLLYFLAVKVTSANKLSLLGALLFGFNPATIVSASQFLTEQLTVTTLLALTLTVSLSLPQGKLNSGAPPTRLQYAGFVVLGGLATLILHLKTALFPTVAIVLLLALLARSGPIRLKARIVLAMATGFFVFLIPWLTFSKLASGRMALAPNRVPSINLAVGLDLESDAWSVAPPTESVLPIIFDKPSAIVVSLWQAKPAQLVCLFLRKVERLFIYSWNDFCWPVLGLSAAGQSFLQRLLLAGAMLGAIYLLGQEGLLKNSLSTLTNRDFLKLTILLMVAGHFVFIPFETQPRYGFSTVPFLILLSLIAGQKLLKAQIFPSYYTALSLLLIVLASSDITGPLFALSGSIESTLLIKNSILALLFGLALTEGCRLALLLTARREAVLASGAILIAFCALTLKGLHLAPPEWSCTLTPGTRAERQILLPPALARQWQINSQAAPSWAAALIDGEQNLDGALVSINGKPAMGRPLAMLDIEQAYSFQATIRDLAKTAALARGDEAGKLRQWRLVQLPLAAINLDGRPNILTVSAPNQAVTIYGQYRDKSARDGRLFIPSLYGFSALRLSLLGDSRTTDTLRPRVAKSVSLYNGSDNATGTGDLSPDKPGEQCGDYRLYLIMACSSLGGRQAAQAAQGAQAAQSEHFAPCPDATGPMTFKNFFAEVF